MSICSSFPLYFSHILHAKRVVIYLGHNESGAFGGTHASFKTVTCERKHVFGRNFTWDKIRANLPTTAIGEICTLNSSRTVYATRGLAGNQFRKQRSGVA